MKDPAVLFYISDWLTSTSEMDADCRGWYLNLLLHNYDKKTLPCDIEKLAVLAGVKFSEFERFKQVFEHVLKHKFEQTDEHERITNPRTNEILRARETFTEKRSTAGKMSYIIKFFAKNFSNEFKDSRLIEFVKSNIDLTIDIKSEQVLKQVFEQMFELYRNGNRNINDSIVSNYNTINGESFFEIDECAKQAQLDTIWIESVSMNHKIALIKTKALIDAFSLKLKADGELKKELKDFKQHFNNWLRFELKAKVDHKKTDRMHFEGEKSNVEAIKSKF